MIFSLDDFIEMKQIPNKRLEKIVELLIEEIDANYAENRDQPLPWSINHMYTCAQFSKLVAIIRNIDPEIAGIAGAIHDLYVIRMGIFGEHGPKGEPLVRDFLNDYNVIYAEEYGEISAEDVEKICLATKYHTDKENFTDDKFIELIKDVDAFDRFLHGQDIPKHYLPRCKAVLKDLKLI
jgi:HD superfamily phosphohydrolase YqeK